MKSLVLFALTLTLILSSCQMEGPAGPPTFPDDVEKQADDLRSEYEINDEYIIDMERNK